MPGSSIQPSAQSTTVLLDLARQARRAESAKALQFILANQTMQLVPYLIGLFWVEDEDIVLQSGVSHVERHSPFILWGDDLCRTLADCPEPTRVEPNLLSKEQLESWVETLPECAAWFPIKGYTARAGFLIARPSAFNDADLEILREWLEIWTHAWLKFAAPSVHGELTRIWHRIRTYFPSRQNIQIETLALMRGAKHASQEVRGDPKVIWLWLRAEFSKVLKQSSAAYQWVRANQIQGIILALHSEIGVIWNDRKRRWKWIFWIVILFPVRLTVLAPGELVPSNPAIIRVPVEGVVDEFYVAPNDKVVSGQPLFKLDLTMFLSRLQVAQQEMQIASQEYRQSALQSLTDAKSRGQLATQEGKAAERKIETDYLQSMLEKAKINAPRDGIVIFDDPSEWIGKPVVAGEKVMMVATEGNVEIEAWIPVGDILELSKGSPVTLFLNATPFSPVSGNLRYLGHEPLQRPDGTYAYRVRASLPAGEKGPRTGLKGTAKVSGQFVPLIYWVLRKPLASLRQFVGI